MRVDESATCGLENDGEQVADADAAEGEAADTRGPAALLLEDYWVGDEGEVEGTVDNCDIDIPEETRFTRSAPCPFLLSTNHGFSIFPRDNVEWKRREQRT